MAYHVYGLIVNVVEGGSSYLLTHLLNLGLIIGFERSPDLDTSSGNATFYVKVPNKRKFEAYFNRRWHESADPVRFAVGKPTYESYKSDVKKNIGKDVKDFIDKNKAKKIISKK